ncbi:serine-rich adhesin for platelets-like [Haliotis rubra]|uniref:serine-rich adhesin for platelets-like n=1 Tax=Haliotis rubra TaxID=36100 RepID=UPI001EE5422B|nr:serine-rich adhesin for platelets-like [Haliotis rubra]
MIAAVTDADVTVTNSLYNINTTVTIPGGESRTITVTKDIALAALLVIEKRGVLVQATTDVSVYAFNFGGYSSYSFNVLPAASLGTRHYLASFGYVKNADIPTFGVVATENNTVVSFKFRLTLDGDCGTMDGDALKDGYVYNITLDEHDVFEASCTGDFTGTMVLSSKPLGVVSGHLGSFVPVNVGGRDTFAEMIPSRDMFGQRYVLHGPGRDREAVFRILATEDETNITTSEDTVHVLMEGTFWEIDLKLNKTLCIYASSPVMVLMYGKGASGGPSNLGDPFLIVVPPVERFTEGFTTDLSVFDGTNFDTHVTVVTKTSYAKTLAADYDTDEVPSCRYSVARAPVTAGTLTIGLGPGMPYAAFLYAYLHYEGNGMSMGTARQPNGLWSECPENPCLNNGTCTDDIFNYTCTCLPGFTGSLCEESLAATVSSTVFTSVTLDTSLVTPETSSFTIDTSSHTTDTSSVEMDTSSVVIHTSSVTMGSSSSMTHTSSVTVETSPVLLETSSIMTQTSSVLWDSSSMSLEMLTPSPTPQTTTTTSGNSFTTYTTDLATISTPASSFETSTTNTHSTASTTGTTSSNTVGSTTPVPTMCVCRCSVNVTKEEIELIKQRIQLALFIDKRVLSKSVRRLVSVLDTRRSATSIGAAGIAVIVSMLGFFLLTDVVQIWKDLFHGPLRRN